MVDNLRACHWPGHEFGQFMTAGLYSALIIRNNESVQRFTCVLTNECISIYIPQISLTLLISTLSIIIRVWILQICFDF